MTLKSVHTEDCAMLDDGPCTCGSDEIIDELLAEDALDEIEWQTI